MLLVDTDPQGSLTVSLGVKDPDDLDTTISDLMQSVVENAVISPMDRGILKDIEGVNLVLSNIGLSSFEVSLVNTMSREFVLPGYLEAVKQSYDYVLIDCMPSLGMLTINAMAAADSVLIPCQANYLSTKGLKLLMGSVAKVRRQINLALKIDGILLTMVDNRTNNAKSIIGALRQTGSYLRVLNTEIPFSVRAAECSVEGKSIFAHDSKGKVAVAYTALVKEVIALEQRNRDRSGSDEAYNDLFSTQAERDNAQRSYVTDLPTTGISDFPSHPFKVRMDEEMERLVDSVKERGILSPVLVRPMPDNSYQMVSGHRCKLAAELVGLPAVPCIVRELTDDEAIIVMVDSNLQREQVLPSEKAFAYKMRLDAMKRQGECTDLTFGPVGQKSATINSRNDLAAEAPDSSRQIHRYIRLINLIPLILSMVDNTVLKETGKPQMALRPAVELSYLPESEQTALLEVMEGEDRTPSHAQAIKIRSFSEQGKLNPDVILSIMQEEKPNQVEQFKMPKDRLWSVIIKVESRNARKDGKIEKAEEGSTWERGTLRRSEQRH